MGQSEQNAIIHEPFNQSLSNNNGQDLYYRDQSSDNITEWIAMLRSRDMEVCTRFRSEIDMSTHISSIGTI